MAPRKKEKWLFIDLNGNAWDKVNSLRAAWEVKTNGYCKVLVVYESSGNISTFNSSEGYSWREVEDEELDDLIPKGSKG